MESCLGNAERTMEVHASGVYLVIAETEDGVIHLTIECHYSLS